MRGKKKLPGKRGLVDGPGGYRGKDDRDDDKKDSSNASGGVGGQSPGPGPGGKTIFGATPDPIGGVALGGTTATGNNQVTNTNINTGVTSPVMSASGPVTFGGIDPRTVEPSFNPDLISNLLSNIGGGIQSLASNITPANIMGGVLSAAAGVPFLGGILMSALSPAQAEDTTENLPFDLNPATGTFQRFDPLQNKFIDDTDFTAPQFTPDDDLVVDSFVDRFADAVAAPNISTGIQTLTQPRFQGIPQTEVIQTEQMPLRTQQEATQDLVSFLAKDLPTMYDSGDFVSSEDFNKQMALNEELFSKQLDATGMPRTNTPVLNPEFESTTPVIDPMAGLFNYFGELGTLPDEQQQIYDDQLIDASVTMPVRKPTRESIPVDQALDALMMAESSSTPDNVNFPMGDFTFDPKFGAGAGSVSAPIKRAMSFGPFQLQEGTFNSPGYNIDMRAGLPEETSFADVINDYDLSRIVAGNLLTGLQQAGEEGSEGLNFTTQPEGFVSPEAIAAYNTGLRGLSKFDDPLTADYLRTKPISDLLETFGIFTDT